MHANIKYKFIYGIVVLKMLQSDDDKLPTITWLLLELMTYIWYENKILSKTIKQMIILLPW